MRALFRRGLRLVGEPGSGFPGIISGHDLVDEYLIKRALFRRKLWVVGEPRPGFPGCA